MILDIIGECLLGTTNCKSIKCPHDCQELPTGPQCICKNGYRFNNKTNQCDVKNNSKLIF